MGSSSSARETDGEDDEMGSMMRTEEGEERRRREEEGAIQLEEGAEGEGRGGSSSWLKVKTRLPFRTSTSAKNLKYSDEEHEIFRNSPEVVKKLSQRKIQVGASKPRREATYKTETWTDFRPQPRAYFPSPSHP